MSAVLTDEQIAVLVGEADAFPTGRYRYLRPLSEVADQYVSYVQNPDHRFMLGVPELDAKIRGFGRGELAFVTGKPHEGKTVLAINAIVANPDRRVLMFTLDEVADLVLAKLIAAKHSIPGDALEERIKHDDSQTIELVKRAATEDFPNLVVIDQNLGLREMADCIEEAQDYWGDRCDLVILDYLDLLRGDVDVTGTVAKANKLKNFTKQADVPVMCIHQASRGSGPRGQSAGIEAMRYGGDDAATFVIEVFRKRGDKSLDPWELQRHQNTITFNVAKNKRPPSLRGEVTCFLDPQTGAIRELRDDDFGAFNPHAPSLGEHMRGNW